MSTDRIPFDRTPLRASLRGLTAAALCLAATGPQLALAAPPQTVAQYVAQVSYDAPRKVVDYCSTAVPTLKAPMETELGRFSDKLEFAAAAAANNLGMKLSDPVSPELQDALKDVNGSIVERAKQAKADEYCPQVLAKLKATTAESLRMAIETEFADNEAEARKTGAAKP